MGVALDGLLDQLILAREPGVVLMHVLARRPDEERFDVGRLVFDAAEEPPLPCPVRWRDRPSAAIAGRNASSSEAATRSVVSTRTGLSSSTACPILSDLGESLLPTNKGRRRHDDPYARDGV